MLSEEQSKKIVERILGLFKRDLISVILYGSYSESRETPYSDIDLLIIAERVFSDWREKRQIEVSLRREALSLGPISPRIISLREFLSAFENYNPLILNVLSSGKILYDTGDFASSKKKFEKIISKKIVKKPDGYWEVAL